MKLSQKHHICRYPIEENRENKLKKKKKDNVDILACFSG